MVIDTYCTLSIAGQQLNMEYVELATSLLRQQLGLTLFGFDVIVEQHTGEFFAARVSLIATASCRKQQGIGYHSASSAG